MHNNKTDAVPSNEEIERPDYLLYVLSALLLLAMGAATLYHIRYANVDETVMPGNVVIREDAGQLFFMRVDEDMRARISYRDWDMRGTLVLDGAERDTILYKLSNAEFMDGTDSEGLAFLVCVPRTGLQGDHTGPWMVYFSYPPGNLMSSDWVFAEGDGTALVGHSNSINPMVEMRDMLVEHSQELNWRHSNDDTILLTAAH